jgi:glycerophosphoryl diester phosphodiesterase
MSRKLMIVALSVGFLGCVGLGEVIVIAHRGASGYLPEHTLEAYAMAYALGADFIEPDLVMTKDGVLIDVHDIYLEDVTNVEEVFPDRRAPDGHWYAADFTLAEIKQLRVHERCRPDGTPYFSGRFPVGASKFEIPTLEEVIQLVQGLNKSTGRNVGIYPELKSPSWNAARGLPMEKALLDVLYRYGYHGPNAKVFIQCFEADTLKKLRFELGTDLPLIMLIYKPEQATEQALDEYAKFANGIGPAKELIEANPSLVEWAHQRGLVVHPWTFRKDQLPKKYPTLQQELAYFFTVYRVDGVFTDFTDIAVAVLKGLGLK